MSRPSHTQQEILAEFLEQNPGIAKGLLRTAHAKHDTRRKWQEISSRLNSLGGAQKDGKGWAKYWADKKCALKKICAQHAQSMRRTGGGPPDALPAFSPIEKKFVDVMGGLEFGIGDTHVAVNPFPGVYAIPSYENSTQNVHVEIVEESPNNINLQLHSEVQTSNSTTDNTIPHVPQRERSPLRTRSRSRQRPQRSQAGTLSEDRRLFASIERQRVEAEMITANALRQAVDNIGSVATAINNLSASITEAAQIIAQAMSLNTRN